MKVIRIPVNRSYFLLVLMAVVWSACQRPDASESALTNASENVSTSSTSFILQSTDGGLTWQDISLGLPENEQPEGFFAGESDVYMHINNELYHSKTNLKTPAWEKENVPDLKSRSSSVQVPTSIVFNRSGVMAFNADGKIYLKTSVADTDSKPDWLPIHANFKKHSLRSVFETTDGTLFLGYEHGLYKSVDHGQHWKEVQDGPTYNMVESPGVLLATRGTSIMRSTDHGEHWEGIIGEGRVGHTVERIDGGFIVVSDGNPNMSRKIRISLDNGDTWNTIGEGLPPSMSISSIKQIGHYLICGHPDGIFRSSDMGKTWTQVYHGVVEQDKLFLEASFYNTQRVYISRKNVFSIYKSGLTLYAVAKIPGC